jgi:hypothetical protein
MSETFETELWLATPGDEEPEGDVTCTVHYNPGWSQAGCRSGHPDNWTPDEGENAEILQVIRTDTNEDILARLPRERVRRLANEANSRDEARMADVPDYAYDDVEDYCD